MYQPSNLIQVMLHTSIVSKLVCGSNSSIIPTSFVILFKSLPIGLTSKNFIGALIIPWNIPLCKLTEALIQILKNSKVLAIDAIKRPTTIPVYV